MEKSNYHHKDLKTELINKGLKLYNEVGYSKFSMRKVASLCNVSHNAPYRHFKNKEEMINAFLEKASTEFQVVLVSAIESNKDNPQKQLKDLGANYINFFIENKEYQNLFFNSDLKITVHVNNGEFLYHDAHLFDLFVNSVRRYLKSIDKEESYSPVNVLEFWSTIHGLTTFISSKKVIFDNGYKKYVDDILNRVISNIC